MKNRLIQKSFEFFYRYKYRTENYRFFFTDSSQKIYDKFIKDVGCELSVDFIYRYLIFQFTYWQELNLTQISSLTFSHIFGLKAITRYKNRNQEYDWQFYENNSLSKDFVISKKQFYTYVGYSPYISVFTNNRDPIKLKYLNTNKGLSTCLDLTTLYNSKDQSCIQCNFKEECIELLKANYPKIYKSRNGK